MTGFNAIGGDIDTRVYQKRIDIQNVSKYSINRLKKYVKERDYISMGYCGHEFDCCGCLSSTRMTLFLSENAAIIEYSEQFNY